MWATTIMKASLVYLATAWKKGAKRGSLIRGIVVLLREIVLADIILLFSNYYLKRLAMSV